MRITHRVSLICTRAIRRELAAMGIEAAAEHDGLLLTFEVDESFVEWPRLRRWLRKRDVLSVPRTTFTDSELDVAPWLALGPAWQHGYPQPRENDFGYLEVTYDRADYCETCGIGLKQKAPFRMRAEPRWGRHGVMQLNWVFDEYFVKPDIWARLFKPRGIKCRAVTGPRGVDLKTVVQLVVTEEVRMVRKGLSPEKCRKCRRTRFCPVQSGPDPPLMAEPRGAIARTDLYFGSGAASDKVIVVARDLAADMRREGIRGVEFSPVGVRARRGG